MANMYKVFNFVALLCMALSGQTKICDVNGTSEIELHGKSEVLSRRKRFIVFPEGSSFQLVFCTTYPMIVQIGDIFLYGYTAALAWELPQDPYSPFDHHADPLHRRVDSKVIYYTNENGKVLFKRPYKRKPMVNPAFAKRSVDSANTERVEKTVENFKINMKQMHALKNNRWFLNSTDVAQPSDGFHRSSRVSLYQKIETLLRGLGTDGKRCLLKTLCVVGKTNNDPQGTFLQEILRAVFSVLAYEHATLTVSDHTAHGHLQSGGIVDGLPTFEALMLRVFEPPAISLTIRNATANHVLPKGSTEEEYQEYEAAHYTSESCDVLFPECNETLLEPNSPILSY